MAVIDATTVHEVASVHSSGHKAIVQDIGGTVGLINSETSRSSASNSRMQSVS